MSRSAFLATWLLACSCTLPLAAQPTAAELVVDLASEPVGLSPRTSLGNLTSLGNVAVYAWDDNLHGIEPWVSDGTDAGTRLLADLCPGPCSSAPYLFSASPGHAFFFAADGSGQNVLHFTDGSVVRRHEGNRRAGIVLGDSLYFIDREPFYDENVPFELWRVASTTGVKTRLATLQAGIDLPTLATAGGVLYVSTAISFDTLDPNGGDSLRRIGPWGGVNFVHLSSGRTVFRAYENAPATRQLGGPPAPQFRLWVTDGTAAGTRSLGGPDFYAPIVGLGAKAYFVNAAGFVYETDGNSVGISDDLAMPFGNPYQMLGATPQAVYYLAGGKTFSFVPGSGQRLLFDVDTELVGSLADGRAILARLQSPFLYVSDGSPAGTQPLLGQVYNRTGMAATTAGGLLFQARSGSSELWRTDGTTNTAFPVLPAPRSSHARLYQVGSRLYAETALHIPYANVFEVFPETQSASPLSTGNYQVLGALPDALLLRERITYLTHSAHEGTLETLPVTGAENPTRATPDGRIYFTDDQLGQKLWETDGTSAGTRVLLDARPDYVRFCGVIPLPPEDCYPEFPFDIEPNGDQLFFVARLPDHEWTVMVFDRDTSQLRQLSTHSDPYAWIELTPLPNGKATFLRYWDEYDFEVSGEVIARRLELWVSDGTTAGTRLEREIAHGASLLPTEDVLFPLGERVFFRVPQADLDELWTYHPATGTSKLADFVGLGSEPGSWLAIGDRVFFQAATLADGRELWQSDGTVAGTRPFLDLAAGGRSSNPRQLYALGDGRFVFAADDGVAGHELWISDGSAGGTRLLADIDPGYRAGSPSDFLRVGNVLYFQASRLDVGRELFRVNVPPQAPPCPADRLCLRGGRFEAQVTVKTPAGQVVTARRVFAADAAGMFTFFSESNWEMMVKVLDGCALNSHFWVFAAAATDLEHTLTVKDLTAGTERSWTSPAGPAKALTDSSAFATCSSLP